jgi:hypothetical protein
MSKLETNPATALIQTSDGKVWVGVLAAPPREPDEDIPFRLGAEYWLYRRGNWVDLQYRSGDWRVAPIPDDCRMVADALAEIQKIEGVDTSPSSMPDSMCPCGWAGCTHPVISNVWR